VNTVRILKLEAFHKKSRKRQVIIMSIFEFNDEILEQIREDDRKFAREDGFLEGHIDAIQKMIRKDFSKEEILEWGYSEEEYEKAKEGLLSSAVL
jgi:hypothetical protein